MPVVIPENLPANKILSEENVFVINAGRAVEQDIRPLKIVIVNLMPTKITTETQLLRLIGNTPLQVDIDLVRTATHQSKNTSLEHLENFYKTFDEIKDNYYDGMVITGAPVEQMDFDQVDYWDELTEILDFAKTHVFSTMFICWGAQAALYYYHGVPKYKLADKMFGVFEHTIEQRKPIVRGFDDIFYAPHSRHTEVLAEDIGKVEELEIIAQSPDAGVFLATSKDGRQVFVTGHPEYDPTSLYDEYIRDVNLGMEMEPPRNYFPNDDDTKPPVVRWRGHGNLLFSNWLNYHVYQETPFDLNEIGG